MFERIIELVLFCMLIFSILWVIYWTCIARNKDEDYDYEDDTTIGDWDLRQEEAMNDDG